ncbi:MAG: lysophospholipid acyltransferase family protein [Syntrophobacteraceae bacterium]
MKVIRSVLFYIVLFLSTILVGLSAIVSFYVTGRNEYAHICGRFWAKVNLWAAGVTVHAEGLENIEPNRSYVYAANHQSFFDIPAAYAALPVQFRWLAKKELFGIFIFGPAMSATGAIPIDRGDSRKAFESLNEAAAKVQSGTSVFIFPEGTRSSDGRLLDFKTGGFILAIKSQQPILPVSISGSYKVMSKKGGWVLNPGVIRVTVGKPIATIGLKTKDRDAVMSLLREAIRKNLTEEEGGLTSAESAALKSSIHMHEGIS